MPGVAGSPGLAGDPGMPGATGPRGLPGPVSDARSVYTRWGKKTCQSNATLLYEGTCTSKPGSCRELTFYILFPV